MSIDLERHLRFCQALLQVAGSALDDERSRRVIDHVSRFYFDRAPSEEGLRRNP